MSSLEHLEHAVVLFEDAYWSRFLPLVYSRPVFELTCGMGSLLSKAERLLETSPVASRGSHADRANGQPFGVAPSAFPLALWCRPELAEVLAESTGSTVNAPLGGPALLLNGRGLWKELPAVTASEASWVGVAGADDEIACVTADADLARRLTPDVLLNAERLGAVTAGLPRRDVSELVKLFGWPWELIHANESALVADWREALGYRGEQWGQVHEGSHVLAPESVYIGPSTRIKPCVVIDAEDGPVWIGQGVTVLPHSYIQGPAYIGDDCLIQPGAVIHAGTTLGPRCKVGGEVEASIIHGYSNKQHDGFLGHSYVGSWVNIAADCINSDLKNTYGTVRVPIGGREVETGEMFVGMLVGDYSKLGINVSFPTGAVIGFCSSVVAAQSPKFVPSFTWLDGEQWEPFDEERGLVVARKVMARRRRHMTDAQEQLFRSVKTLAEATEHRDTFASATRRYRLSG